MSTFGSSVRDPEREAEEARAKQEAREMDIRALYKQVMTLQTKVSELQIEIGRKDGNIQMLNERLTALEKAALDERIAKTGSGASAR